MFQRRTQQVILLSNVWAYTLLESESCVSLKVMSQQQKVYCEGIASVARRTFYARYVNFKVHMNSSTFFSSKATMLYLLNPMSQGWRQEFSDGG